jgi:hypothetical protein
MLLIGTLLSHSYLVIELEESLGRFAPLGEWEVQQRKTLEYICCFLIHTKS